MAASAALGCSLFNAITNPQSAQAPAPYRYPLEEQAEHLKANGYPLPETLAYGDAMVDDQKWRDVLASSFRDDAFRARWQVVDRVRTEALEIHTDPQAQYEIDRRWARAHATLRFDANSASRAGELMSKAVAARPTVELWKQVAYPEHMDDYTDETMIEVCNAVRPLVEADETVDMIDFLERCFEAANGDASMLWPNASKDHAKLAKLHREQDAEAAKDQAFAQAIAALFPAGGDCIAKSCDAIGWTSLDGGDVETRCISGDCFGIGWQSNTPKGVVNTRCMDEDCLGVGWKSKGSGGTWVATCKDGDCQLGWVMKRGSERYTVTLAAETMEYKGPYLVQTPGRRKYKCSYPNIDKAGIMCEVVD